MDRVVTTWWCGDDLHRDRLGMGSKRERFSVQKVMECSESLLGPKLPFVDGTRSLFCLVGEEPISLFSGLALGACGLLFPK